MIFPYVSATCRLSKPSALALALACAACADDDSNPNSGLADTGLPVFSADAGLDAGGSPALEAGAGADASPSQCITTPVGMGMACSPAGGGFGYRLCQNGVPVGDCMSLSLGEAGVPRPADAGTTPSDSGVSFVDGAIVIGDAAITLEAGALRCPAPLFCSQGGALLSLPLSACAETADGLPPMCPAAGQPCKVATANGSCMSFVGFSFCVVPCN